LALSGPDTLDEDCIQARTLGLGAHWVSLEATHEIDGASSCGSSSPRPDRWFRFTAPALGTIRAKTCGTHDALGVDLGVDTVISWHASCPGNGGNELACSDDSSSCLQIGAIRDSEISAPINRAQTLFLRLSPYFPGIGDLVRLELSFEPANDYCGDAIPVGEGLTLGSLVGATNDGSATCSGTPGPDVWYSYTAPVSGKLTLTTCGTNDLPGVDLGVDTILSLHTGCPGTAANTIACNDDSTGCSSDTGSLYDSRIELVILEGQSVLVRVSNYGNGMVGDFFLDVDLEPNGAKLPR
jgi:hypothetical protein